MGNNSKNILVTGGSGYIGAYVLDELVRRNKGGQDLDIYSVYNSNPIQIPGVKALKLDLSINEDISRLFRDINPHTVIHLASGTPTRISGHSDEHVRQINIDATKQIARLCRSHNSLMIYTSSDLVYQSGANLTEDSAKLNPITTYAQTKLEGENAVREYAAKFIIFRTALVYGFTRSTYKSFFDTAYSVLSAKEPVTAFTDQYRNPIYAEDAATIIAGSVKMHSINDTINMCGDEYLSRYDMCARMCEIFGFKQNLVIPASVDEFTLYPMVKQLGLNNTKLKDLGFNTRPFRESLIRAMNYRPR